MRGRSWLLLLSVVLVVAGLGSAVREEIAAARLSAALAASLQSQAGLLQEVGKLHRLAMRALPEAGMVKPAIKRMPVALVDSPDRAIANKAQLRGLRIIRSTLDLNYRSFLTRLGLSPDQINRWESASAEYRQRMRDLSDSATQQGLKKDDLGVAALRTAEENEWQAQEAELVGRQAAASIHEFTRTAPASNLLSELAGSVSGTNEPMTAEQGGQVRQLIADASESYRQGGSIAPNAVDWDAVFAGAQKILSGSQLAAFRTVVSDEQTRAQLRQRVNSLSQSP